MVVNPAVMVTVPVGVLPAPPTVTDRSSACSSPYEANGQESDSVVADGNWVVVELAASAL